MRNFIAHLASSFSGAFVLVESVTVFVRYEPFFAAQPLGSLFLFPLLIPLVYIAASFLSSFLRAAEFNSLRGWLLSGFVIGLVLGTVACLAQQTEAFYAVLAACSLSGMVSAIVFWLLAEWQPSRVGT